jgi:hypothetical protein
MKGVRLLILGAFLAHGLALGELFSVLEGLALPEALRALLGWGRAAATAAVLSFSSASLAKHLVERSRGGTLPVFLWITESVLLVILIAPLLVFQLRRSALVEIVPSVPAQWLVCVAAVLAIEISVAGGMYCRVERAPQAPEVSDEDLVQEALRLARRERSGPAGSAGSAGTGTGGSPGTPPSPRSPRSEPPPGGKRGTKYRQVIHHLKEGISGRHIARQLGIAPSTVSRYRKRAIQAGEMAS